MINFEKINEARKLTEKLKTEGANSLKDIQSLFKASGIEAKIVSVKKGIRTITFFVELALGEKVSHIKSLAPELELLLGATGLPRIFTVTGSNHVAIEVVVNDGLIILHLNDILKQIDLTSYALPLVVGRTMDSTPFIIDLADAPHMLIGGTSGAGKSELANTIIHSLIEKYKDDQDSLEFVLIDPKGTELSGIKDKHKNTYYESDMDRIDDILDKAIEIMESRYKRMQAKQVKNIKEFRKLAPMSYIVIVIDELADILLQDKKKDKHNKIVRLLQKARAAGIHIVVNTQRPSVDVISGIMKANFDCRIALKTADRHHSGTILGQAGAELLVGKGDMLVSFSGKITRIQGALVG